MTKNIYNNYSSGRDKNGEPNSCACEDIEPSPEMYLNIRLKTQTGLFDIQNQSSDNLPLRICWK